MAIGQIADGEVGSSVRGKLNQAISGVDRLQANYEIIATKSDLPTAVGGVITLTAGTTYVFKGDIDLTGDRLVAGGVISVEGTSSETSSLTSTGLVGQAILTSEYTLPMRHITFKDAEIGVALGSGVRSIAADWFGVNFLNCGIGVDCADVENFVFNTGAFLDGSTARFTGAAGSIVFNDSIFVSDGTAKNSLEVTATANISRRLRATYCAFVTFGSSTGVNFSTSATVPDEGYILDTCNFSGGGTYQVGVDNTSNKTLFVNNVGIVNTSKISQYYMNGNATVTTIGAPNSPTKVLGTTTSSSITAKFTNTDNRATYSGAVTQFFKVVATLSVTSGNNNQIGVYIAKNGTVIGESEVYGTTSGAGRAENIVVQTIVELATNDYVEIFVENSTAANNITVTDLNVIVD